MARNPTPKLRSPLLYDASKLVDATFHGHISGDQIGIQSAGFHEFLGDRWQETHVLDMSGFVYDVAHIRTLTTPACAL